MSAPLHHWLQELDRRAAVVARATNEFRALPMPPAPATDAEVRDLLELRRQWGIVGWASDAERQAHAQRLARGPTAGGAEVTSTYLAALAAIDRSLAEAAQRGTDSLVWTDSVPAEADGDLVVVSLRALPRDHALHELLPAADCCDCRGDPAIVLGEWWAPGMPAEWYETAPAVERTSARRAEQIRQRQNNQYVVAAPRPPAPTAAEQIDELRQRIAELERERE